MPPDKSEALRFIELTKSSSYVTIQTFSNTNRKKYGRILTGSFDDVYDKCARLNRSGHGVYITVNECDGSGRSTDKVIAITGVFADFDGTSLDPVLNCPVKPLISETSPGRYQTIWVVDPIRVTAETRPFHRSLFKRMQIGLAKKFGSDRSVNDLSRVCRLPGFVNHKYGIDWSVFIQTVGDPSLPLQSLAERIGIDLTEPLVQEYESSPYFDVSSTEPIYEGMRNVSLFRVCTQLARQGVLGPELLNAALEINARRCDPLLEYDEVMTITGSVTDFRRNRRSDSKWMIELIKERNPYLCVYQGRFYKYDRETKTYRVLTTSNLHHQIFHLSHRTMGHSIADLVLEELATVSPYREILDNPEREFLKENVVIGGKVVLHDLYRVYESWCHRNKIKPKKQPYLKYEADVLFPGTLRDNIRVGQRQYRGFLGISLKVESSLVI